MIKIYVRNLAKYVTGSLEGKWLTLPMNEEQLQQEIKLILGNNEEYAIHDYEAPFNIGEYDNIVKLNEIMQKVAESISDKEEFTALCKVSRTTQEETLQTIIDQDYTIIEVTTDTLQDGSDIARKLHKEEIIIFLGEIPENLMDYIDWEQVWRECEIAYNWAEVFFEKSGRQFAVNIK